MNNDVVFVESPTVAAPVVSPVSPKEDVMPVASKADSPAKGKWLISFCGYPELVCEGTDKQEAAAEYFRQQGLFFTAKEADEDNKGGWVAVKAD